MSRMALSAICSIVHGFPRISSHQSILDLRHLVIGGSSHRVAWDACALYYTTVDETGDRQFLGGDLSRFSATPAQDPCSSVIPELPRLVTDVTAESWLTAITGEAWEIVEGLGE